jgi:hypothetical protein
MYPLIDNKPEITPLMLSMGGAVGQSAPNAASDVVLVQSMLNAVAPTLGGPPVPLKVDGLAGRKTIGAINQYQSRRLGFCDGRVAVCGKTIRSLLRTNQDSGKMPSGLSGVTSPPSAYRSSFGFTYQSLRFSKWRLVSSSGLSLGIGTFGVAGGRLLIVSDDQPAVTHTLRFSGFGAGLSTTPVGLDVSFQSLPSTALRIVEGPLRADINSPADLTGPCQIFCADASVGGGVSATLIVFGVPPFVAYALIIGVYFGIPGAGVMGYWGWLN